MKIVKNLIITIFITVILFILIIMHKNKDINRILIEKENTEKHLNNEIKDFYQRIKIENENNFSTIDKNIKLISAKGDTVRFSDVVNDKMFVFRYSVLNCNACVYKEFENIRNTHFQNFTKKNKMMFVVYYQNVRDLVTTYRSSNLEIPFYILPNNNLGLQIERYQIPYYFLIDSTFQINNVFIPVRDKDSLTVSYLNSIKNSL